MPRRTKSKKTAKFHHKIIKKVFQRGSIAIVLLVLVAVGFAVALTYTPELKTIPTEINKPTANSCLDFDPPNASVFIIFNSQQYNLIKKEAGISDSKMNEMAKVGNYNNQDLYTMTSTDYFGQQGQTDIVYSLVKQENGYHYFDIYIKAGTPIPDSIKNSKSIGNGGTQQVIIDDVNTFPPAGFNTTDIRGLNITISAPAFIYANNKTTLASISRLENIARIGTLTYSSKNLLVYYHLNTTYLVDGSDAYEYIPTDTPVQFSINKAGGKSLQAKGFTVKTVNINPICWYTPVCKPVVYLYPEKKTEVTVKIDPQGYITASIPELKNGWDVTAFPGSKIIKDNKEYPYLYYETAIEDSKIDVPKKGYVVKSNELATLFNDLLPKLGLKDSEAQEFIQYWDKTLPKSPYYFVGILPQDNINFIEKMTISPKPDTTIRVRIYFEALDSFKEVEKPVIAPILRPSKGFLAVEWGGLVKTDPDHPFTCSQ